jgi:hypothetical protein
MSSLYSGSTPKYLVRIRDEAGIQLDPSEVLEIIEVLIWIYNALDGTIVAKFYLNTLPSGSGWRQADTKEVGLNDVRVLFTLTAAETEAAPPNKNEIQIAVTIPDDDFPPDNERIIIKTGRFSDIRPSKTS